jgi:hypothetical protein
MENLVAAKKKEYDDAKLALDQKKEKILSTDKVRPRCPLCSSPWTC